MSVRTIQSKDNAHVKELRTALAAGGRSESGLVGIEGPKMLEEALRAGLRVAAVFVAQGSEALLEAMARPAETEILRLPRRLLDSALATETPQPVAALVEPPEWSWADVVDGRGSGKPLVVVLAGIQDPGNLGTILRSGEAFGATGVVSLPGTVSAWNPKAVRASAGSVFRVPLVAASERECFARLREANIAIWATVATQRGERTMSGHDFSRAATPADLFGALAPEPHSPPQPADRVDLASPVALLIGNEGSGVAGDLAAKADAKVTIPCPGPVESLNAAVAASVLLYEAARQRACSGSHPFYAAAGRAEKRMGHGGEGRGARR